jgi:hypothetical protein
MSYLNTNESDSELLGVFKTSRGVRIETRDTEGEVLESVYIEEPQFDSEPESMPSMVNTGYGYIPMPKSNQLNGKPLVDVNTYASGLVREWNDDTRVKGSWSSIADRFHVSDLMNLHTSLDLVHAMRTNPNMVVCKTCNYQVSKNIPCRICKEQETFQVWDNSPEPRRPGAISLESAQKWGLITA